jgi:hypothetical protein
MNVMPYDTKHKYCIEGDCPIGLRKAWPTLTKRERILWLILMLTFFISACAALCFYPIRPPMRGRV